MAQFYFISITFLREEKLHLVSSQTHKPSFKFKHGFCLSLKSIAIIPFFQGNETHQELQNANHSKIQRNHCNLNSFKRRLVRQFICLKCCLSAQLTKVYLFGRLLLIKSKECAIFRMRLSSEKMQNTTRDAFSETDSQ